MSFSATELNYLILRYLEESGLNHSAFLFARETQLDQHEVGNRDVPSGALVHVVQKGLAFVEFESKANLEDGEENDVPRIGLLDAASVDPSRPRGRERTATNDGAGTSGQTQRDRDREARTERAAGGAESRTNGGGGAAAAAATAATGATPKRDRSAHPAGLSPTSSVSSQSGTGPGRGLGALTAVASHADRGGGSSSNVPPNGQYNSKKHAAMNGMNRMELEHGTPSNRDCEIAKERVRTMRLHTSEVFVCSWNPARDCFGTGSGDSTARIWHVAGSGQPEYSEEDIARRCVVLPHSRVEEAKEKQDVTSLDWDREGNFLATSCYDGQARLWTADGKLLGSLGSHHAPIFAIKFNERGNLIASAAVDNRTIVWDRMTMREVQQFSFHASSALDVEWMDNETFASCSTDKSVIVNRIGSHRPIKIFKGHKQEVNSVKYDKHSRRLASCADDTTLKVWSMDSDKPLMDVLAHTKDIFVIRWAPAGHFIASGGFDRKVRLWDVSQCRAVKCLEGHTLPIHTLNFSPDQRYLASGGADDCIYIWDMRTDQMVLSHTGCTSGVVEVNFNKTGEKLAACCTNGTVHLLDTRQLEVTTAMMHKFRS